MSPALSQTPRERVYLPGFIPGSLYVVILERVIPSVSPSGPPADGTNSVKSLGLFYQEKPTLPPSSEHFVLQGRYWGLLAPNHNAVASPPGGHRPVKLSIPIPEALGGPRGDISMEDVLGYVRIAEGVDLRTLEAHIGRYDDRIDPEMTSETYVFNALSRLRRSGALLSIYWSREAFDAEIEYFRSLWSTQRAARAVSQRMVLEMSQIGGSNFGLWNLDTEAGWPKEFAEVWWCEFTMQEHRRRR